MRIDTLEGLFPILRFRPRNVIVLTGLGAGPPKNSRKRALRSLLWALWANGAGLLSRAMLIFRTNSVEISQNYLSTHILSNPMKRGRLTSRYRWVLVLSSYQDTHTGGPFGVTSAYLWVIPVCVELKQICAPFILIITKINIRKKVCAPQVPGIFPNAPCGVPWSRNGFTRTEFFFWVPRQCSLQCWAIVSALWARGMWDDWVLRIWRFDDDLKITRPSLFLGEGLLKTFGGFADKIK